MAPLGPRAFVRQMPALWPAKTASFTTFFCTCICHNYFATGGSAGRILAFTNLQRRQQGRSSTRRQADGTRVLASSNSNVIDPRSRPAENISGEHLCLHINMCRLLKRICVSFKKKMSVFVLAAKSLLSGMLIGADVFLKGLGF